MNKYVFCQRSINTYNAGSKAVKDATNTAIKCGYKRFYYSFSLFGDKKSLILKKINSIVNFVICLIGRFRIRNSDTYFIQWPTTGKTVKILFDAILEKQPKIIVLIHDIDELRGVIHQDDIKYMERMFNIAERIIVHSESMKKHLIKKGISAAKMEVMYTFDYLTKDTPPMRSMSNIVTYAGNLYKSTFLHDITTPSKQVRFFTYGAENKNLLTTEYKGKFSPEKISALEGSWGLVWDGNSIYTCDGEYGKYLRYNSPHKVSLYIVAELPLLIWEHQALAEYVKQKNIGICISSIDEIAEKIAQISDADYGIMLKNIKEEALTLKSGGHLSSYLIA